VKGSFAPFPASLTAQIGDADGRATRSSPFNQEQVKNA